VYLNFLVELSLDIGFNSYKNGRKDIKLEINILECFLSI